MADPVLARRDEAARGAPQADGGAAKVWNEWLEERDRAPAEALTEWFKQKTLEGLEAARGYAQAGLDLAKSRTEVALSAKALLDDGGEPAREAVRMKQLASRAVAADQAIVCALRYHTRQCREEAAFHTDPALKKQFMERSIVFASALEALGEPPQEPPQTAVERDAAALLRFGQVPLLQNIPFPRPQDTAGSTASYSGLPRPGLPRGGGDGDFEQLLRRLFELHDLNNNGSIEEQELIKLNEKIAMLHYGKGTDKQAVKDKFSAMFREKLDANGNAVGYEAFRDYTVHMLKELDNTRAAQEMILEQFIAEAESARAAFHCPSFMSVTDAEFLPHLAGDRPPDFPPRSLERIDEARPRQQAEAESVGAPQSSSSSAPGPGSTGRCHREEESVADRVARAAQEATADSLSHPSSLTRSAANAEQASCHLSWSSMPGAAEHPPSAAEDARQEAQRRLTGGFATGDKIQVFSNSKGEWLDGLVVEAFDTKREADGYSVPAGTLKVSSAAGIKWVRQDQVASTVRPRPAAA